MEAQELQVHSGGSAVGRTCMEQEEAESGRAAVNKQDFVSLQQSAAGLTGLERLLSGSRYCMVEPVGKRAL